MKILAVETSCDETAIAIAEFSGPRGRPKINVLSNIVSSQVGLHAKFGGVVPNLAKREHQRNLVPILLQSLKNAGWPKSKVKNQNLKVQLKNKNLLETILEREPELLKEFNKRILTRKPPPIDAIAITYGPGLAPALWVGVNFAKALAYLWGKPLIPVNHMEGHFFSALLQKGGEEITNATLQMPNYSSFSIRRLEFPAIALLVSGGHTELVLAKGYGKYKIVGETLDDAAGEAFDKVARILGLGYPGGPAISALAEKKLNNQNEKVKIRLPRPMIATNDYNFSFSGLKTAVLYLTRGLGKRKTRALRPLIAKEFQGAVVDVLVEKTVRAAKEYKAKMVLLGGGVAANSLLRKRLAEALVSKLHTTSYELPALSLTGDNALMISVAAYLSGKGKALDKIGADANLNF